MQFHPLKSALALFFVALGPVVSCSDRAATPASSAEEDVGTLSMPLTTVVNGTTYRLVNATFSIYQTNGTYSYLYDEELSTGADGGADVLTESLPTGTYEAMLEPYGWSLQVESAPGLFQPVNATLTSAESVAFTIDNGATTTISFTFQTDGVVVIVGAGTLNVGITVNQPDAACAALGTGCGPGFWCPPATLTGADLACVTAGSTAVGQTCSSPTDCVANSTCIAAGDGGSSLCTALCTSAGFNLPCASGGTCQSVTSEYGICQGTGDAGP
jgi:hypothetical protein